MSKILTVGGGIGGLAAALACTRMGAQFALFERSPEFTEVGAGIQLGPNVVKILHDWGLKDALARVASFPDHLQVRCARSAAELGCLRLGETMLARYGSPYATVHRADLHALLLSALNQNHQVSLHLAQSVTRFEQTGEGVSLHTAMGPIAQGDVLVGADGLWSQVRQQLLNDGVPRFTGHLAYRAMVAQAHLPERLQSRQVTVWLGPRLHVVQYPVRGGAWLNVVAIVHGSAPGDMQSWDHRANVADLRQAMKSTCAPLQDLIQAIGDWRLWPLSIRPAMQGAHEQAQGRVALLGDAAHPMVPYLAQGAGMAIEDAAALAQALSPQENGSAPERLARYAGRRWQRNARVQSRALRNGHIFHASGITRWGRDAAMQLLGERLLDMPWLYAGA